eukprot:TRINITY_DN1030_c0_g2_i1.p1 TRINITY_DN1030_c0_g2~~TRINITY_DN1030_c0_g2_i1.p1  ORF type:complete len:210 (+),score=52.90 TRINITY_DN1030_c0_g2_i1:50-679(+)
MDFKQDKVSMLRRRNLKKIIVLGESGVGKTSLLVRYVDGKFSLQTKSTIGADFLSKQLEIDDQGVTLQIWDTAGQERFAGLGSTFYRGSDGAIFVFDVSRVKTFEELAQWKQSFLIQVGQEGNDEFPMMIIANKIDRPDRVVTTQQIARFCEEQKMSFIECSAKDDFNVSKAFEDITRIIIEKSDPEHRNYNTVPIAPMEDDSGTDCEC